MIACADCGRHFENCSEYKIYNHLLICRSAKVCEGFAKARTKLRTKKTPATDRVTDHELDRRAAEWLSVAEGA